MERGDDDGDCEYASYSGLYSSDEESLCRDERFTMERSSNWFLHGCAYVYIPNICVYEGGIEYEEHGDASTVGYYCVDASVLEDQIE